MAPSPELGQPKAPDKTTSSSTSVSVSSSSSSYTLSSRNCNNENSSNASAILSLPSTSCYQYTTSASMTKTTTTQSYSGILVSPGTVAGAGLSTLANSNNPSSNLNTGTSAMATNSDDIEEKNIDLNNLRDNQLKQLLDEAYSYKNPKDRENKSEIFRKLLQNVEREKEDNSFPFRAIPTRYIRGSNSHKQGGSLQNLVEAAENDSLLDGECNYGNRNRRHHHNSRPKKYSSVSSRQREGGSLPSNVNVSNCNLSICDQPFLNEVGKRRGKNERTCSGTSYTSAPGDTIIDMGENCLEDQLAHQLAQDSLAQGIPLPLELDDGIELTPVDKSYHQIPLNMANHIKLDVKSPEPKAWVDETINIPALERVKNVDTSCLSFDESYKCCNSLLGDKSETVKPTTSVFSQSKMTSPKQFDENGNSLNSSFSSSQSQGKIKKKKSQSDRNTTSLNIKSVPGYRGEDPVHVLVKFIENSNPKEKTLKQRKEKEKKKEKDKDEKKKIKKSNSLEELRSCTKLDEDEKMETPVTMRTKSKKNNEKIIPGNGKDDGKEIIKQQPNNKRGERRSWGTEEWNYLNENSAIEEVREKVKEKEKFKKPRDLKDLKDTKETVEKLEKPEKSEKNEYNKRRREDHSLSVVSMESVQSESAEFHVVTKKKKAKKRQAFDGGPSSANMKKMASNTGGRSENSSLMGLKKYQASSHFTNDRDVYLKSLNSNESRRKSTSSVPPSEKSDSSDLDSVHSLPVESSSSRHGIMHSSSHVTTIAIAGGSMSLSPPNQVQPQSYADIARIVNLGNSSRAAMTSPPIDKMDKWPIVHSGNVSGSSNEGSSSSSISAKNGTPNSRRSQNKDFPDLVSDKSNNQNNDAGSSCSSTSSTSTIVKQVTYSQNLGEEKHVHEVKPIPNPKLSSSKLSDVKNDNGKQSLQKSKSVDAEVYYSIDQYPALEKTVKRHPQQNAVINSPPMTNSSQIQSNLGGSKQRSNSMQSSASNANIGNIVSGQTNNQNTATFAITTLPSTQSSDNKSKVVVNHNVDINMNTNSNLASTSSPSNLSNINNANGSINVINTPNNGKKLIKHQQIQTGSNVKTNVEPNTTTLVAQSQQNANLPIVEINNARNKQQIVSQNAAVNTELINANVNSNKKMKSDTQTSTTNTGGRKNKKEKNNQTNINNAVNSSVDNATAEISDLQQFPPLVASTNKHSNRPAVIILNDMNDTSIPVVNDFTFGDFNEEELRLFENHLPLDDSGQFNAIQFQDNITISNLHLSNVNNENIHLSSPHSDRGYSSLSNNRRLLSESSDGGNVTILPPSATMPVVKVHMEHDIVQGKIHKSVSVNNKSGDYYIENVCNVPLNCINTIYYQQQPQPPPPPQQIQIGQQQTILTNLGTNVVAVPIAGPIVSVQAPINFQNNSSNSNSDFNANSYPNSELQIIEVDSCNCCNNSNGICNNKQSIAIGPESINCDTTNNETVIRSNNFNNVDKVNSNIFNNNDLSNQSQPLQQQQRDEKVYKTEVSSSTDEELTNCKILSISSSSQPTTSLSTLTTTTSSSLLGKSSNLIETKTGVASSSSSNEIDETKSSSNLDNNNKTTAKKEINVRFVAPPVAYELNSINYEKIVDFVGLAWQEVCETNRGAQFYNGQ